MNGSRQELASRILSQRAYVNGAPINAAGSALGTLRGQLQATGVRSGDVVVLKGLQGRELLTAAIAVWLLDGIPLPTAGLVPLTVSDACQITRDLTVVPGSHEDQFRGLDATAVLHMSSGSTDQPKIAKRGVASVLLEAEGYRTGLSLVPSDCVAVPIPLAHSLGWGVAISALLSGCSVDAEPFIRATPLARKIDSGSVTVVTLTAPLARLAVATEHQGSGELRAAMVGAGSVTEELDNAFRVRFGQPLLRGYGSSETGGTFFGAKGIGKPVPGVEIIQPPPGDRGELILRLAAPVEGYLDGCAEPAKEWNTGDVVHHGDDGNVYFIERMRGPLRLNGRFIRADLIENALRSVPGVKDVFLLVLPRADAPETEDFYAIIEGNDVTRDCLTEALAGCQGEAPLPRVIEVGYIPRNTIGKTDRQALIHMIRKEN